MSVNVLKQSFCTRENACLKVLTPPFSKMYRLVIGGQGGAYYLPLRKSVHFLVLVRTWNRKWEVIKSGHRAAFLAQPPAEYRERWLLLARQVASLSSRSHCSCPSSSPSDTEPSRSSKPGTGPPCPTSPPAPSLPFPAETAAQPVTLWVEKCHSACYTEKGRTLRVFLMRSLYGFTKLSWGP